MIWGGEGCKKQREKGSGCSSVSSLTFSGVSSVPAEQPLAAGCAAGLTGAMRTAPDSTKRLGSRR